MLRMLDKTCNRKKEKQQHATPTGIPPPGLLSTHRRIEIVGLLKLQCMSIGSGHLQKGNTLNCFKQGTISKQNNSL